MSFLKKMWKAISPSSQKQSVFSEDCKTFLAYLKKNSSAIPDNGKGKENIIFITPWFQSTVPFFSILVGLSLAHRGNMICFLWDDTGVDWFDSQTTQNAHLTPIMAYLEQYFPVQRLSSLKAAPGFDEAILDQPGLDAFLTGNVQWSSRCRSFVEDYSELEKKWRDYYRKNAPRLYAFLMRSNISLLFLPGGRQGLAGLLAFLANKAGVDYLSYDGGNGASTIFALNGQATHRPDIPAQAAKIQATSRKEECVAIAEELLGKREARQAEKQPSGLNRSVKADVVFFPSIEWEGSALCLECLFENQLEWLIRSIDFILSHSEATILVRMHPGSAYIPPKQRGLNVQSILEERFPTQRLVIYPPEESANSYDLIKSAKLTIVYSTTVGVEAAMLGKTAITPARCYYAHSGFIISPDSVAEYYAAIIDCLNDKAPFLLQEDIDKAALYYFAIMYSTLYGLGKYIDSTARKIFDLTLEDIFNEDDMGFLSSMIETKKIFNHARLDYILSKPHFAVKYSREKV